MTTHHLLAVWPVTDDRLSLEDLVERAFRELSGVAAEAQARVAGPTTWRLIDAADLEGWEHHDGQLLVATAPAEPTTPAPTVEPEPEPPAPVDLAAWCQERAEAHREYEDHELPLYDDRDNALIHWVVRVLGSPTLEESRQVLAALAARHGLALVAARTCPP
ncbi:hypothetical protein [Micromonospora sp. NPDC003816]|uniref:hypothetical protein n=1 Tax=Micromonospora sp. NPDC003816 TaxID=3364224 RepID=UPI00369FC940